MDVLKPWECEYVVAPAFDARGTVGQVSEAVKMPLPCYAENRVLPPFPHIVDAFNADVWSIGHDPNEGNTQGRWIVPQDSKVRDPKDGTERVGRYTVVRPWDHVYIHNGAVTLPVGMRGDGWRQKALDEHTYTISNVVAGLRHGQDNNEYLGTGFEVAEIERFTEDIGWGTGGNAGHELTLALMQKDARGKIFPRGGYRLSWPFTRPEFDEEPDRWLVFRRDNDVFGFVGATSTKVDGRATFTDVGVPPDLSFTPPFRRPEGARFDDTALTGTAPYTPAPYPGVGVRYAQRFVLGAYDANRAELKFSSPGPDDRMDFIISTPSKDTDSFIREISSRTGTEIRHVIESSGLLVLTSQGEWAVGGSSGVITPSSTQAAAVGYVGCSHVAPVVVDNHVVFADRDGSRLYAVEQEQELGRLNVQELTTLTHSLFEDRTVRSMAWSAQERILFVAFNKFIAAFTYIPEAQVVALTTHAFGDLDERTASNAFTPSIRDIEVVRRYVREGGRRATTDVLCILAVFDRFNEAGDRVRHLGHRTDVRLLEMPVRSLAQEPLKADLLLAGEAEQQVLAVMETFGFSPQSPSGRAELREDEREGGARAAPEWVRQAVTPFVESNVGDVQVMVAPAGQIREHPWRVKAGGQRNALYGSPQYAHEPSVVVQYSGSNPDADIYAVGIETDPDDMHAGGIAPIYVGSMAVWVPEHRQAVYARDAQTGLLEDWTKDCAEVLKRGGRRIVTMVWSTMSKTLFLVMDDGMLLSLALVDQGLALTEHDFRGHLVLDAEIVIAHAADGTAVEDLHVVLREPQET